MVILYYSYLFAIVISTAEVVSATFAGFRGIDRVNARTPSRKNRPPRMKYRLIDETSIFQKASAVAVQISTPAPISPSRLYKSEIIWETGVAFAAVGTRRRVETGDGGIGIKTRRSIDWQGEACL